MYMFNLFVYTNVMLTEAYWHLHWNDEFDYNNTLDLTKWDVIHETQFPCIAYNEIEEIHCRTSRIRNLWLRDGVLAIAAVRENSTYFPSNDSDLGTNYTSAHITTKQSFTYGRFEVRAALPDGTKLRPSMSFIPTKSTGGGWPKDGQIDLMTNIRTVESKIVAHGAHYLLPNYQYNGRKIPTNTDLNQFHSYILEWNQEMIVWKFDESKHYEIKLNEVFGNISYNPFNSPFKLVITLGVGSKFSPKLTEEEAAGWRCSLLILDYVRIYKWIEAENVMENNNSVKFGEQVSGPESICESIVPLIKVAGSDYKPRPDSQNNFPFTAVFSSLSSVLLLVLIPFIVYMFFRQKKLSRTIKNSDQEYYDDHNQMEVFYEDPKYEDYSDACYQTLDSNQGNQYTVESAKNCANKEPEHYLTMTTK